SVKSIGRPYGRAGLLLRLVRARRNREEGRNLAYHRPLKPGPCRLRDFWKRDEIRTNSCAVCQAFSSWKICKILCLCNGWENRRDVLPRRNINPCANVFPKPMGNFVRRLQNGEQLGTIRDPYAKPG